MMIIFDYKIVFRNFEVSNPRVNLGIFDVLGRVVIDAQKLSFLQGFWPLGVQCRLPSDDTSGLLGAAKWAILGLGSDLDP